MLPLQRFRLRMQAEAARCEPNVHMNPVLLKPHSETGCQVVVQGKVVGKKEATEYFSSYMKVRCFDLVQFCPTGLCAAWKLLSFISLH